MNPIDRIRAGIAEQPASPRRRLYLEAVQPNPQFDRLLAMDPTARPQLTPTMRMALAMYKQAKHTYEAQQGEEQV